MPDTKVRRCNRAGKVIFKTELDAKIALAKRVWKDKGEKRYYPCGNHFHLTSWDENGAIDLAVAS